MGDKGSKPLETNESGDVTASFKWAAKSWKDFPSYKVGQCIAKEVVVTNETDKWTFDVCLYPHGFNERTKHDVSLWLRKKNANRELSVELSCSVKVGEAKELVRRTLREDLVMESVMGWSSFCSRSVILNDNFSDLRDDAMTLAFRMTVFNPKSIPNAEVEEDREKLLQELSLDFYHLLKDKRQADIQIRNGHDKVFLQHKPILAARSDFFRQSFSGFVGIPSIPSSRFGAQEVSVALEFVYAGTTPYLSAQDAERVYALARCYKLFGLADKCRKILVRNLAVDSVVRVLVAAHEHDDFELEESCLEFVDRHLRLVKGRPEWIEMMRDFPELADKALFFIDWRKGAGGRVDTPFSRSQSKRRSKK